MIRPLLEFWADFGGANETFSDFYTRWFGTEEKPLRLIPCELEPEHERVEFEMIRITELAVRARAAMPVKVL